MMSYKAMKEDLTAIHMTTRTFPNLEHSLQYLKKKDSRLVIVKVNSLIRTEMFSTDVSFIASMHTRKKTPVKACSLISIWYLKSMPVTALVI